MGKLPEALLAVDVEIGRMDRLVPFSTAAEVDEGTAEAVDDCTALEVGCRLKFTAVQEGSAAPLRRTTILVLLPSRVW